MNFDLLSNNSKFYELSQWDLLLNQLSPYFKFNTNKIELGQIPKFASKTIPEQEQHFDELALVIEHLPELSEAISLEYSYLRSDVEILSFLNHLEKLPYVSISELNNLTLILEVFVKLLNFSKIGELQNLPIINTDELRLIQIFIKNSRLLVDYEETLFLDRHPKLLHLNQELTKLDSFIKNKTQELQLSGKYKPLTKIDYEIIHDAYYLLVPTDYYHHSMGKINGRSNSGKTLYIEPIEFIELNSNRQSIVFEIRNIIEKLIRELISSITTISHQIRCIRNFLFHYDSIVGRAQFSKNFKTCRPSLNTKKIQFFKNMYLSTIKNPYPNSMEINPGTSAILVSGPNTGGKSVFLKTFANNFILASHGFETCASASNIDLSQNIYFFSHDFQDIESNLSSFSAEVTNYLNAIKCAQKGSIFLFDEIFNSTSSEEASSLSLSLFEHLLENNFFFVATTHHSKLKYEFSKLPRSLSAAFALNSITKKPTYEITYGHPGTSQAFKIFEQIESLILNDNPISKKLSLYISEQEITIENLIQEVRVKQDEIELAKRKLANDQAALLLKQQNQNEEVQELKLKLNHDFRKNIIETEAHLHRLVREIEAKELTKKQALNELIKIEKKFLHPINEQGELPKRSFHNNYLFIIGGQVRHLPSNIVGIITQMDFAKNKVTFSAKGKTLTTSIADLEPVNAVKTNNNEIIINLDFELPSSTNYDCRGLRADIVERDIHRLIYHLACRDIPYLIIIHGHGEGILKNLIREILANNVDLKWKAEDGNDGSTRVELKN
jgi:DNA mismatch repair protein MutS2